ncbi:hypothetical protein WJX72_006147 [[Myrmecia] bisecta]|uniref:Uncharacterized protein n=1 Tax=[Myrmecia] bisecta TaxID=41462 RepID=A0AAW1QRX9_9CHLO
MSAIELNDKLKPMLLKDLRTQCRLRDLNPAGSLDALRERLSENMLATNNYNIIDANGNIIDANGCGHVVGESAKVNAAPQGNNYSRPDGQNVGNFMTERNSSRVLAPPGGASQIFFGNEPSQPQPARHTGRGAVPQPPSQLGQIGAQGNSDRGNNNYHRPAGQNVGNFMTDRNSSRVLAPPGGASQISFG